MYSWARSQLLSIYGDHRYLMMKMIPTLMWTLHHCSDGDIRPELKGWKPIRKKRRVLKRRKRSEQQLYEMEYAYMWANFGVLKPLTPFTSDRVIFLLPSNFS